MISHSLACASTRMRPARSSSFQRVLDDADRAVRLQAGLQDGLPPLPGLAAHAGRVGGGHVLDGVIDEGDGGTFTGEAAADAGGDEAALVARDVEAHRRSRGWVEVDAEVVAPRLDGVADPPRVLLGEVSGVGGDHHAAVGVLAQVPQGRPAGGPAGLSVTGRHGDHHAVGAALGHVDPCLVDEVKVTGLHLAALGEDSSQRARRGVHGNPALDPGELGAQPRRGPGGHGAAHCWRLGTVGGQQLGFTLTASRRSHAQPPQISR